MSTVVQEASRSMALKEFSELLKFELGLDHLNTDNIMNSIIYLEKRGFRLYKDKN